MERITSTPSAPQITNGTELADALYERELVTAKTVGDVRQQTAKLVTQLGTDGEAGQRMEEIHASVNTVAGDGGAHDGIKLEDDLGSGVLGMNRLGTNDSLMRRDQMDPVHIVDRTRYVLDTALHEHSQELGHAGQDPSAAATLEVIDENGRHHDAMTVIEGNVVENVSGHIGQRREGLPQETYLEGADLVRDLGRDTVDSYVRQGGANVGNHLQVEVWRKGDAQIDQMLEEGAAVGMTEAQVHKAAEKLGRMRRETAPQALTA